MPELPEVETVRRGLEPAMLGERFARVEQRRPDLRFPGLVPGDRWCVIAAKWFEAYEAGVACPVVLSATNETTLEIVPLSALLEHAVDRPAA